MVKISIIIPVYKVAPYIQNCLDSVLNQDMLPEEYEIICIDDGSPDGSAEIILDYAKKYSNIFYVYQENQGVSGARNTGLERATGDYILFVDGDDLLYPNVLGSLYLEVQTNNLDLLYLQVDYFDANGLYTSTISMEATDGAILDGLRHQRRGFICSLYRSALLETIRFEEGILIGEDALFNIMVHLVAQRCSYVAIPAYKYLIRSGSALNSRLRYSEKAFIGYLKTIDVLSSYLEQNRSQFTVEQQKYFQRPFFKTSELALNANVIPSLSISRYKALRNKIKEKDLTNLDPVVREVVPFYGRHWSLFMGYYGLKKVYSKLKGLKK